MPGTSSHIPPPVVFDELQYSSSHPSFLTNTSLFVNIGDGVGTLNADGASDGANVGAIDAAIGDNVGENVGAVDGGNDGAFDGENEGKVGACVGLTDGE